MSHTSVAAGDKIMRSEIRYGNMRGSKIKQVLVTEPMPLGTRMTGSAGFKQ